MATVRRPLFWIPTFCGFLIGVVATYLTRPSQTDAQTSRPSLTSLQQQIDVLNVSVEAVEGDILDIVSGEIAVGAVDGRVKVSTFDSPAEASTAGRLRWASATQQLEQSDGTQWSPIALDRAPIIWSGGSTVQGNTQGTGWVTYKLGGVDIDAAAGYLGIASSGTITVLKAGYYRINFFTIASLPSHGRVRILRNGSTIYHGNEYIGMSQATNWSDLHADVTWRFDANDTIQVQVENQVSGAYPYHSWNSSGQFSRLQVSYVGPLN